MVKTQLSGKVTSVFHMVLETSVRFSPLLAVYLKCVLLIYFNLSVFTFYPTAVYLWPLLSFFHLIIFSSSFFYFCILTICWYSLISSFVSCGCWVYFPQNTFFKIYTYTQVDVLHMGSNNNNGWVSNLLCLCLVNHNLPNFQLSRYCCTQELSGLQS